MRAKTPLQRLLLPGVLPAQKQQELLEITHVLDPMRLLHQLEQLQQTVFRCAVGCFPFISSPRSDPLHVFSVEQCTVGKRAFREEGSRSTSRIRDLEPRAGAEKTRAGLAAHPQGPR